MEQLLLPTVDLNKLNKTVSCYSEDIFRLNGVWDGPNPFYPTVPLFIVQLTVAISTIRLVVFVLKPLKQPPFVGEILGGIILGPSVLGRINRFRRVIYPTYSFRALEPLAHLALCYYAFLTGLKMDIKAIPRTGSKAVNVATGGIAIPFTLGSCLSLMFKSKNPTPEEEFGYVFWGASLAASSFPVLSRLLEDQKLNHTEMGKTALGAALISDMSSWIFLGLGLAATNNKDCFHWALLSTCTFVWLAVYYLRPAMAWIIRKTEEGQGYDAYYICAILSGLAIFTIATDAFGTQPIIGAFLYGLVIPNQVLEVALLDRLEEFVMEILMPAFYLVCGIRTNVDHMTDTGSWTMVGCTILLACSAKLLSTFLVSLFCNMPHNEALAIGMLTNTKSIMVMILLEVAQTQKALTTQGYTIMVIATLLMTIIVTPMTIFFWPSADLAPYKRRSIGKAKPDEELRFLACIHTTRNITPLINLLTTINPTMKSPISVFVLQLRELFGRASAGLVIHSSRRSSSNSSIHSNPEVDQIINAFENFELRSEGVTTQALTLRSAYSTMDEDICNIAKDKRAAFIILPFHQIQSLGGDIEDINPAIQSVNEGVLAYAPCSVGILIDHGRLSEFHYGDSHSITILFLGGPDDREALALAWRMAEHPDTSLAVVRFKPGEDAIDQANTFDFGDNGHVTVPIDLEREKLLDDDLLNKFNTTTADDKSISYSEIVLNDEEETVKAIKAMDNQHFDLFIVGKGRGMSSPLTAGLADWCDCPELGAIGDLLVTSEFEHRFSVLVVQRYARTSMASEGTVSSACSAVNDSQVLDKQLSIPESEALESLDSFRKDHDL